MVQDNNWRVVSTVPIPANTKVIGIACRDLGVEYGIVASTDNGIVTDDDNWLCSNRNIQGWAEERFNDTNNDFSRPEDGFLWSHW